MVHHRYDVVHHLCVLSSLSDVSDVSDVSDGSIAFASASVFPLVKLMSSFPNVRPAGRKGVFSLCVELIRASSLPFLFIFQC